MAYQELLKGRFSEPGREYLITFTTQRRQPVFSSLKLARLFIRELRSLEADSACTWLAWVLMPDHFHGLVSLGNTISLSALVQTLKGKSAFSINQSQARSGQLWQAGFHDHALRSEESRRNLALYIINNPVRAGLVCQIEKYSHWDCVWI